MSETFDYGPLRTYEITWRNRAPEMVQGHQVQYDSHSHSFLPRPDFGLPPKFHIHGMFPGDANPRWRLVISAPEADVISIRDVTEQLHALEAMAAEGEHR